MQNPLRKRWEVSYPIRGVTFRERFWREASARRFGEFAGLFGLATIRRLR